MTTEELRQKFESAVVGSPYLRKITPLDIVTINGEFSHYSDINTGNRWVGFMLANGLLSK